MKTPPTKRTQIGYAILAGTVFTASISGLVLRASQVRANGDPEGADTILLATIVAVGVVIIVGAGVALSVHFMLATVKRRARRVAKSLPGSVVFLVSSPGHQSTEWPDGLNGPEVDLPFAVATVFSADSEGLRWWTGLGDSDASGAISSARISAVSLGMHRLEEVPQLVVSLQNPLTIKRFTLMSDESTGFVRKLPSDASQLIRDISAVLGLHD